MVIRINIGSVICVDVKDYLNLTLGKTYYAKLRNFGHLPLDSNTYWFYDDNGHYRGIEKDCFKTLLEIRDEKLESLGI